MLKRVFKPTVDSLNLGGTSKFSELSLREHKGVVIL